MAATKPATRIHLGRWALVSGAVPVLLFAAVLSIPIPNILSRIFSAYSFPLFIFVLLLYYLILRLPAKYGWLAASCLTMLLLGLSLAFLWSSGYSDDKIVGGLLPFRDGFDYYNGANWILSGQAIKILNEGAAWRPLYPGFLSALLFLTGRNLQWAIAIQVGLAGLCLSLAAMEVRHRFGAAAASLLLTLLYFFIQPLLGTTYTEALGLSFGCLGFVLLWEAADSGTLGHLIFGLASLMLAISARAGAFFVFPVLVVWAGWAWRGAGRFSWRLAGVALATIVASYLVANTLFTRLTVEPGGVPFGNFAFTIYGQVAGGAGYHKAFEDLGVRNPAVIWRAAERFFVAHPAGFAVGAAKAYRDFFTPKSGVFSLGFTLPDLAASVALTVLLVLGLYRAVGSVCSPASSLLLATFLGILLSIPFLPPIDGGIRIYASTMPFVYGLPAFAIASLIHPRGDMQQVVPLVGLSAVGASVLACLTIVAPILLMHTSAKPGRLASGCPADQVPYETLISRGSFIDLVPDGAACGRLPGVCTSDFQESSGSNDPSDAQVYAQLLALAQVSGIRIFDGNDLVNGRPHLFVGSPDGLNVPNNTVFGGCAEETLVKGRPSLFTIRSVGDAILIPVP